MGHAYGITNGCFCTFLLQANLLIQHKLNTDTSNAVSQVLLNQKHQEHELGYTSAAPSLTKPPNTYLLLLAWQFRISGTPNLMDHDINTVTIFHANLRKQRS